MKLTIFSRHIGSRVKDDVLMFFCFVFLQILEWVSVGFLKTRQFCSIIYRPLGNTARRGRWQLPPRKGKARSQNKRSSFTGPSPTKKNPGGKHGHAWWRLKKSSSTTLLRLKHVATERLQVKKGQLSLNS